MTQQIKEIGLCLELYLHANIKITERVALISEPLSFASQSVVKSVPK